MKMKKQSFKQKVQSMKPSEIIEAMIRGLKKKWVKIDMETFGKNKNGICYGCAATNTICEIIRKPFPKNLIEDIHDRIFFIHGQSENYDYADTQFLTNFENAVDFLRKGQVYLFNHNLFRLHITTIPSNILDEETRNPLPFLQNPIFIPKDLKEYSKLAKRLKQRGY